MKCGSHRFTLHVSRKWQCREEFPGCYGNSILSMRAAISSFLTVVNVLHGKSLPSNAGLMVGKRVLQGEAWSDLSDSRGTHDLGDKLGDKFGDLGDK
ncbi:hypothetical protein AVEN_243996-1 [Araneus ventricosus]|uniref:Uncharacterized protein n=1 Tax=Araneus ventricosus TaxID=182803 RepID=A0A4Y2I4X5_ARAVE|nr:hypothetical protein AVEN_243996-1 [Araneus ventricosus]